MKFFIIILFMEMTFEEHGDYCVCLTSLIFSRILWLCLIPNNLTLILILLIIVWDYIMGLRFIGYKTKLLLMNALKKKNFIK